MVKNKLFLTLTIASLFAFSTIVSSTTATAGVVKGNWIKYGEINVTGTGYPSELNNQWIKVEVINVEGNTVSVLLRIIRKLVQKQQRHLVVTFLRAQEL
jgi:hypothetical protein